MNTWAYSAYNEMCCLGNMELRVCLVQASAEVLIKLVSTSDDPPTAHKAYVMQHKHQLAGFMCV